MRSLLTVLLIFLVVVFCGCSSIVKVNEESLEKGKEKIVYKTNVTTVKTGDNTNIVIYVILLFVSLLCIFSFLKKKQIKE